MIDLRSETQNMTPANVIEIAMSRSLSQQLFFVSGADFPGRSGLMGTCQPSFLPASENWSHAARSLLLVNHRCPAQLLTWGVPSPDGRHLAVLGQKFQHVDDREFLDGRKASLRGLIYLGLGFCGIQQTDIGPTSVISGDTAKALSERFLERRFPFPVIGVTLDLLVAFARGVF